MNNEQLKAEHGAPASEDPDWDVETVIEQVWQDLQPIHRLVNNGS